VSAEIFRRDQANQFAPKTPAEVAAAAKDLAANGYSDYTIGQILRLDVAAVRQLIGERSAA
jgi:hypothetical protein